MDGPSHNDDNQVKLCKSLATVKCRPAAALSGAGIRADAAFRVTASEYEFKLPASSWSDVVPWRDSDLHPHTQAAASDRDTLAALGAGGSLALAG